MSSHHLTTEPDCPSCGQLLDGVTGISHDRRPKPGDLSICAGCGTLLEFTKVLTLQVAPKEVVESLSAHDQYLIRIAQETAKILRKGKPEGPV